MSTANRWAAFAFLCVAALIILLFVLPIRIVPARDLGQRDSEKYDRTTDF